MTRQLDLILREGEVEYELGFDLDVNPSFLDQKGKAWLQEIYEDLGGQGNLPLLEKLKFDFKLYVLLFSMQASCPVPFYPILHSQAF